MVLQNYQNLIEMTSNMIYIVAFCSGSKCPSKIHLNTQWGGGADYANRNNSRPYGSSGLPTAMPTVITYETAATDMTPTVCLIPAKSTKILVLYFDFE